VIADEIVIVSKDYLKSVDVNRANPYGYSPARLSGRDGCGRREQKA
jgi:hypothetical protein